MGPPAVCAPDEMVAPLRDYCDQAFEAWRRGEQGDVVLALSMLIAQLCDIRTRCLRLPNDLHFDMQCKMAIGRDRPPCHGKDPRS
jgi:hypothetical protein